MTTALSREEVDALADGATAVDLARHLVLALQQLDLNLASSTSDRPETKDHIRALVAQLSDDLRMLRESRSGRIPSLPPAEGRPRQSRPDAPLAVLRRQLEAVSEGMRMLMEEGREQGSALIPDAALGELTPARHLAAMLLRVRATAAAL